MTPTIEAPLTYEDYAVARDALAALADERAVVLKRNLDDLRRWLAAGAGERWRHYESVVQQAREQDLALAMWWESEWRRDRHQRRRAAEKACRPSASAPAVKAAEPANAAVQGVGLPPGGSTEIAAPRAKSRPGGAQRPVPARARSFSPAGPVWRR